MKTKAIISSYVHRLMKALLPLPSPRRRCLELEYMLSTQSERSTKRGSEDGNDISSLSSRGGVPRAGSGPVSRRSAETSTPSFVGTSSRRGVVGGGEERSTTYIACCCLRKRKHAVYYIASYFRALLFTGGMMTISSTMDI